MFFKKMTMRTKLVLTFLVVGVTPLLISNVISYYKSAQEIESQAIERAKLVATNKANYISSYFEKEATSISDVAASDYTFEALKSFSEAFKNDSAEMPAEVVNNYKQAATKFYTEQFGGMYFEKNQKKLDTDGIVASLDSLTLAAQYDFIVENENPLGKKDNLLTPKRSSPYGKNHEKFHPYFKDYLTRHALYDIFLVNAAGRVVYTVFKETDFATSLKHGPWANSGLAKAFEKTKNLKSGEVHIEDFMPYVPSYESPASFASTPILKDGNFVGALIIQLPLDKISSIAGKRDGLGEKGETLLLGSDLKLRADTFRNKDTHNVQMAFAKDSKIDVSSEAVKKVQAENKEGYITNTSYDGLKTLAYYMPLKINDLTWYVVVELAEDEIYAGMKSLSLYVSVILLVGIFGIGAAAFIFGNNIAKNLREIVTQLNSTSREVSAASLQSAASATELSEASTEQAASLQETMASIEEISAMVNQNSESAQKTQAAVNVNQKVSEDGSRSVAEMLQAINEIKETNEEVLHQMELSNKEFGEIVKIISEIGLKTNVINEIVFQTKLLSFNASVEAARAGEHGKGFAVVAEEVGNLAQMSGNAAKEITTMLSDSIKKVDVIVEGTKERVDRLIETGKDKIAMGQSTAEKCRDALNKITENARSVASMMNEIAHASKEQSQGIQEINKAISQLDQVTQQNSAVAQQSSTQAEQLSSEAVSLADTVNKLVTFVEGDSQNNENTPVNNESKAKVISMNKKKNNAPANTSVMKKVAGGDSVPNSNDPQFEDL